MTRFSLLFSLLLFGSLSLRAQQPWTLRRALDYALTNSPDVRLARQRIEAARAGIEQANSAFWPHLQFQSSYSRTDNPMMVFGSILNQRAYTPSLNFNDVPDVDDFNVKGVVTLPLYRGGRSVAGRKAARAGAGAARQDARAVRNALAFEVTSAFFNVLKMRQFVRAMEAAVHSYETNLTIAKSRLAAGTLLKTSVLDVEVRLAQAREDLVSAQNAETLAERSLRNALGIEQAPFVVADTAPNLGIPAGNDFSRRPELAASRQRERAAEAQLRAAKGGYLPSVSAFAGLGYDYGWKFDGSGRSYEAGVQMQWDVWDGNLTRGKVRQARANLEAAREQTRKIRLALDLEAEQARLQLRQATQRLDVTKKAVAQATESVNLTRARFEQGLALSTQLIDSQTALTGARVRRAEAMADQHIAIAALRKALGLPPLGPSTSRRMNGNLAPPSSAAAKETPSSP